LPLVLACGARSALDDYLPLDAGVDVSSSHRDGHASEGGSELDAPGGVDAPSGFDAGLPADAGPPPPPPASFCAMGTSDASTHTTPVAAANVGGTVSFVDGRGVVTTPYVFPPKPDGMYRDYAPIASRGDYIAAAVADDGPSEGKASAILRVALLDLTGAVLFAASYTVPYQSWGPEVNLVGNGTGLFIFGVNTAVVTFSPRGGVLFQKHYTPVADPDGAGRVLVLDDAGNSTQDYYWLDALRGTVTATRFLHSGPTAGAALYGPSLLYATSTPPTLWLETPLRRTSVSQGNAWGAHDYPTLDVASSAPWALACWSSGNQMVASRIAWGSPGGPATMFQLSPPPGASFLDPGYVTTEDPSCPWIDAEGDSFQFFVVPDGIQAFRTATGTQWEALGAPMGRISAVGAVESGGTYLLGGSSVAGPPFLGPDGGAGVSVGAQMQVIRPASGASVTLQPSDWTNQTYPAYLMTRDGGCIAYFESGALTLADARAGVVHTTALMADTANEGLFLGWTNVPGDGQVWTDLGD
jgi:hypothetical protein